MRTFSQGVILNVCVKGETLESRSLERLWERLTEGVKGRPIERWVKITEDNTAAADQLASDPRIAVIENGKIGLTASFADSLDLVEVPPSKRSRSKRWTWRQGYRNAKGELMQGRYHGGSKTVRECDAPPDLFGNQFSLSDVPERGANPEPEFYYYPLVLVEGREAWKKPQKGEHCPVCWNKSLESGHYCLYCDKFNGVTKKKMSQDVKVVWRAAKWMLDGHDHGRAARYVSLTPKGLGRLMVKVCGDNWSEQLPAIASGHRRG